MIPEIINEVFEYRNHLAVHGAYYFSDPSAYHFAVLPEDAVVNLLTDQDTGPSSSTYISCSVNTPAAIIAIVQIVYATLTLYHTRGNEAKRFGYAAYGLTVLPYVLMSLFNLLGNLLTPTYASMYMVRSAEMEEAEAQGCRFDGVIGSMDYDHLDANSGAIIQSATVGDTGDIVSLALSTRSDNALRFPRVQGCPACESADPTGEHLFQIHELSLTPEKTSSFSIIMVPRWSRFRRCQDDDRVLRFCLTVIIWFSATITPFLVINALTSYDPGQSTLSQRAWTMAWLACGTGLGTFILFMQFGMHIGGGADNDDSHAGVVAVLCFLFAAPAIGGFVKVGEMLRSTGYCTVLGG